MKSLILTTLTLVVLAGVGTHARAGEESLDIETNFRAKIAKEKVKQEFQQRKLQDASNGPNGGADPSCGSQSIGNIDTGGRIGAAPREVFVFAPNAINMVTASGCH